MKKAPKAIDLGVGQRIRLARAEAGRSQEWLAGQLGITFQQIQKYEKGTNRVGPSSLDPIAKALGKSVSWFFNEGAKSAAAERQNDILAQFLTAPHGMDLAKSFLAIKNNEHRITIARVAEHLAG